MYNFTPFDHAKENKHSSIMSRLETYAANFIKIKTGERVWSKVTEFLSFIRINILITYLSTESNPVKKEQPSANDVDDAIDPEEDKELMKERYRSGAHRLSVAWWQSSYLTYGEFWLAWTQKMGSHYKNIKTHLR